MKTLATWTLRQHQIALEYKLADMWVGMFWQRKEDAVRRSLHIWVCIVPCLPIHLIIHLGDAIGNAN